MFREFNNKGLAFFEILPVFGVKSDSYHTTGGHMSDVFTAEFIDEGTNTVIMTKDDGRIKTVIKGTNRLNQITVAKTVKGLANF